MIISIIAAMSRNRVIGHKNRLPWNLPADMKRFRELTLGKPVIMGRKTFESIGKPLPKRKNIIITRDKNYRAEGCIVVHSGEDALKAARESNEVMVIGGEQIFKEFMPIADRMYLTFIEEDFEGDTYFPEFGHDWKETYREEYSNNIRYSFVNLERK